jgi:hypothetical protein
MALSSSDWSIEGILASPLLWGIICLVAIAVGLSGKLDMSAAKWILLAAWVMAIFSFYRFAPILNQPLIPRILWVVLFAGAFGLTLYYLSEWMSQPRTNNAVEIASPSPAPNATQPISVYPLFSAAHQSRNQELGAPRTNEVQLHTSYFAQYENAVVIWIAGPTTYHGNLYVLGQTWESYPFPTLQYASTKVEELSWYSDDCNRARLDVPKDKLPPYAGLAQQWYRDQKNGTNTVRWVGGRQWHVQYSKDVYIQEFDRGFIVGPFSPVEPSEPAGDRALVFILTDDHKCFARIVESKAPQGTKIDPVNVPCGPEPAPPSSSPTPTVIEHKKGLVIVPPRVPIQKRPIQTAFDQLQSLIQEGDDMRKRLKEDRAPIPSSEEVQAWGDQLDEVAACCASVSERKELRDAYHHVDMTTAVISRLGTELDYGQRIVEIVGKIAVAKKITARIHREDKA